MMHKIRIAFAVTLLALATVSAVDTASASLRYPGFGGNLLIGYLGP
jgi:hypothetical protein